MYCIHYYSIFNTYCIITLVNYRWRTANPRPCNTPKQSEYHNYLFNWTSCLIYQPNVLDLFEWPLLLWSSYPCFRRCQFIISFVLQNYRFYGCPSSIQFGFCWIIKYILLAACHDQIDWSIIITLLEAVTIMVLGKLRGMGTREIKGYGPTARTLNCYPNNLSEKRLHGSLKLSSSVTYLLAGALSNKQCCPTQPSLELNLHCIGHL